MKRMLCFLVAFLIEYFSVNAKNKTYIITGMGNYETLYAGVQKEYRGKHSIEFALGTNPFMLHYQMGYLSGSATVYHQNKIPFDIQMQLKALVWNYEDRYVHFIIFTPNPELRIARNFGKIRLAISGGYVYNTPLLYKRKTYLEVGWPREWQPSFSIQTQFRIQ